jgi:hypothetical protein
MGCGVASGHACSETRNTSTMTDGMGAPLATTVALLQKAFVVSVGNMFMVLVRETDIICMIQKINHLLYQLERIDTKN